MKGQTKLKGLFVIEHRKIFFFGGGELPNLFMVIISLFKAQHSGGFKLKWQILNVKCGQNYCVVSKYYMWQIQLSILKGVLLKS